MPKCKGLCRWWAVDSSHDETSRKSSLSNTFMPVRFVTVIVKQRRLQRLAG